MVERKPAPFTPEEIAERAYFESLTDALYTDPDNHKVVEEVLEGVEDIAATRAHLNSREGRSRVRSESEDGSFHTFLRGLNETALILERPEQYRMFWAYEVGRFAVARLEHEEVSEPVKGAYEQLQDREKWAFFELVAANTPLAVAAAKKAAASRGGDVDRYTSAANDGIRRAVEKFDQYRGTKFSTYANWWTRQAIQRSSKEVGGGAIHVPEEIRTDANSLREARRGYSIEFNREPNVEELSGITGIDEDRIRTVDAAIDLSEGMVWLDRPMGEDGDGTLMDTIADANTARPESRVLDSSLMEGLVRRAQQLDIEPMHLALFLAENGVLEPDDAEAIRAQVTALSKSHKDRILRVVRSKLSRDPAVADLLGTEPVEV